MKFKKKNVFYFSIHKNASISEMAAILSRGRRVNDDPVWWSKDVSPNLTEFSTHGCHWMFHMEVFSIIYPDVMPFPDSKVHGANMGPIWGKQGPDGPYVGPMNFAIWDVLKVLLTVVDFHI